MKLLYLKIEQINVAKHIFGPICLMIFVLSSLFVFSQNVYKNNFGRPYIKLRNDPELIPNAYLDIGAYGEASLSNINYGYSAGLYYKTKSRFSFQLDFNRALYDREEEKTFVEIIDLDGQGEEGVSRYKSLPATSLEFVSRIIVRRKIKKINHTVRTHNIKVPSKRVYETNLRLGMAPFYSSFYESDGNIRVQTSFTDGKRSLEEKKISGSSMMNTVIYSVGISAVTNSDLYCIFANKETYDKTRINEFYCDILYAPVVDLQDMVSVQDGSLVFYDINTSSNKVHYGARFGFSIRGHEYNRRITIAIESGYRPGYKSKLNLYGMLKFSYSLYNYL